MISVCVMQSRLTQLTLAVFVTLIRDKKLVSYLIKHGRTENDVTDLVSCDKSHETSCKILNVCREVRKYIYSNSESHDKLLPSSILLENKGGNSSGISKLK